MSSINRLATAKPTSASQIPFNDPQNGRDSKASVQDFATLLQSLMQSSGNGITQYEAPQATGYALVVKPVVDGQNVWVIVNAGANYATGTITFPPQSNLLDRQTVEVISTKNLTALTLAGNGASVVGAPTALSAYVPFKMRYDAVNKLWYPAL